MLSLNLIGIDADLFTQSRQQLAGELVLSELDSRVSGHELLLDANDRLAYRLTGGVDRWQRPFVDIEVSGQVHLQCQRCLRAMTQTLNESAHMVLFADEQALDEAMLADDALDGAVFEAQINAQTLLEDQILMALPFSPKHDECSEDMPAQSDKTHPFAALAALTDKQ
ncbi:YceD family protein [Stenoxybacter acetivorans]|uniref:YceD family protein n=1 Tax=Stenoxybacter acetivorans TaxID=422441 RepID=UPI000690F17C|nr:YceD family protein [Stenoxybacter acetivorans]